MNNFPPTPCERCNTKEELILLTLNFGGGKEKRWLLCKYCIALIELTIRGSKNDKT